MAESSPKSPYYVGLERDVIKWADMLPASQRSKFIADLMAYPKEHEKIINSLREEHDRVVNILQRVIERKELTSGTDDLTKLVTRKPYFGALVEVLSRPPHPEIGAIGILWVDLDDFKQVNDKEGHKVGDLALSYTSATIKETIRITRKEDFKDFFERVEQREMMDERYAAGRWGGDEFLVTVELRSPEDISTVGRRLKNSIEDPERQKMRGLNLPSPLTASIGAVSFRVVRGPLTMAADILGRRLIDIADNQMYKSKINHLVNVAIASLEGEELVIECEGTVNAP